MNHEHKEAIKAELFMRFGERCTRAGTPQIYTRWLDPESSRDQELVELAITDLEESDEITTLDPLFGERTLTACNKNRLNNN